jgi:hypothetical protein
MQKLTPSARLKKAKRSFLGIALLFFLIAGGIFLSTNLKPQVAHAAATNLAVTTYRNDNAHTGQYPNETALNTTNVNASQFGKRVSYPVDGQLYAQPLYLPNLTIGGQVHNVVFAATENDSVYAFDADQTSAVAPLWKTSLLPSGATAVPISSVFNCGDLNPVIGITGTPVIDPSTNTMYVVAYSQEGGNLVYRLHALDVTTGLEKGTPIVIQGSAPGTGAGSVGGTISFDPHTGRQRSALVLSGGKIYITFSSFCDSGTYHGWIFSYNFNGSTFQQANAYDDTPAGSQGGIWGGDGALATDDNGNFYFMDGNGSFNANTGGTDVGDSFVRLNAQLQLQDYFTPFNQLCLDQGDVDLGSGGPLLLTGSNVLIGAGKEGRPYVISTTNMGKYTADPNLTCGSAEENRTDIDKIQQELPPGAVGSTFSIPAFWNGPNGQYVYFSVNGGPTKAFSWINGKLSTAPTSMTAASLGFTGGDAVVSSDGTAPGTGILWTIGSDSILRAYDASNLANELYDSSQNASRDGLNGYVKYSTVALANGEAFVGTSANLAIFGLLSSSSPTPTPTSTPTSGAGGIQINAGGPAASPFIADADFAGGATSATGNAITTTGVTNPAPQAVYQTNRYGTFSYTIPGLTAGKSYTVRLHFAETYWTAAGKRTFNVSINGTQVLTNFDIFATAGGEYIAVVEQFSATASTGGTIGIQFTSAVDNAQVNGIEVLGGTSTTPTPTPTPTPPPTPTPTPPPGNGSVQINAGGPAVSPFIADTDFTGGTTVTSTNTIDTSGVTNPAPQAVYQTNRYGNFTYAIPGLTAGKSYTVRLHFAETYWTATGKRTFNVSINSTQVLTKFDIFATAGAANKAVVEQLTATASSSGAITIQFTSVVDNAQVNGIEVLGGSSPPPPSGVQINAGGPAVSPFVADTDFTGGTAVTSTNTIDTSGVTNPAPVAVYQSNRFGTFSYTIPGLTAGKSYTVRLHFAETYWTAAGKRTFNVSINGAQVLTNFDIFATAGAANKAVIEQFTATASSSGAITIQFTSVVDNAQVNGIEILS